MNDNFILVAKERNLLNYIDTYCFSSFPKNEMSLKIRLSDNIYKLIENTIRFNINKGVIRNKYINETKANIMFIDYYIELLYSKDIILKKYFLSIIRKLNEIKKIVNSLENLNENN